MRTRLAEDYRLRRCRLCSFISVDPLPTAENLEAYYEQEYWQRYDSAIGGFLTLFYRLRVSGIIKDIKKFVPPEGRILDWGAGDGRLVKLLEGEGFAGYGIDTYHSASRQKRLVNATIEHAPFRDGYFDGITCFHVLEHLYRPVSSLQNAFRLLKPGGILVIEVPNIASIGFKIFKQKWYPLDVPVHLNHFTPGVLHRMFDAIAGSQVVKTSYFSHRHAPSSLVLSLLPAIAPPRVRAKHSGHFPIRLMVMYLLLQLAAYPFALFESWSRRGEVVRMCVRKKGPGA